MLERRDMTARRYTILQGYQLRQYLDVGGRLRHVEGDEYRAFNEDGTPAGGGPPILIPPGAIGQDMIPLEALI
jgi:hypothetical protein